MNKDLGERVFLFRKYGFNECVRKFRGTNSLSVQTIVFFFFFFNGGMNRHTVCNLCTSMIQIRTDLLIWSQGVQFNYIII